MSPIRFPNHGLYVITRDDPRQRDSMLRAVDSAIRGGAAVVQYRAKHPTNAIGEATALMELCRRASIPLIINDDVALAAAVGADGVHLGRDDDSIVSARHRLGHDAIVGVSCYDDIHRAEQAVEMGASYVAFGRFFPSSTKPEAPCARLQTLELALKRFNVPVVAIGGITLGNAPDLLAAGADLLAVIEGVFGEDDPESAAGEFRSLWGRGCET
jgi:thiamine-phosphate pyrophosphorylase